MKKFIQICSHHNQGGIIFLKNIFKNLSTLEFFIKKIPYDVRIHTASNGEKILIEIKIREKEKL